MIIMYNMVMIFPNWITDLGAYTLKGMFFLMVVWVSYNFAKELERNIFDEEN